MYGVVNGVYYCNNYRVDEINNKIFDRNIPSHNLQMQFDPRPINTKFVLYPTSDIRQQTMTNITPIRIQPCYNMSKTFNPGNDKGPYSGYATNVDTESSLKDINMANQKWCSQTRFVPSSNSDLYQNNIDYTTNQSNIRNIKDIQISGNDKVQDHSLLFEDNTITTPFDPNACNIGYNLFNNHTRQQVKNLAAN